MVGASAERGRGDMFRWWRCPTEALRTLLTRGGTRIMGCGPRVDRRSWPV